MIKIVSGSPRKNRRPSNAMAMATSTFLCLLRAMVELEPMGNMMMMARLIMSAMTSLLNMGKRNWWSGANRSTMHLLPNLYADKSELNKY